MPDLLNRDDHEQRFAYSLAAELSRERRRLVAYGVERLPDRPAVEWDNDREELAAVLLLMLRDPWFASYYRLSGSVGINARPGDIEAAYRAWSSRYAQETAQQITDNTKDVALAAAAVLIAGRLPKPFGVPSPFEPGQVGSGSSSTATLAPPQVRPTDATPFPQANLFDVADDKRIVRGAISMVTDAASAGEFAVADAFKAAEEARIERAKAATAGGDGNTTTTGDQLRKRQLVAYWHTERDGRVCKICRPLNGRPESEWRDQFPNGPKAHVACRCYLDWRVE